MNNDLSQDLEITIKIEPGMLVINYERAQPGSYLAENPIGIVIEIIDEGETAKVRWFTSILQTKTLPTEWVTSFASGISANPVCEEKIWELRPIVVRLLNEEDDCWAKNAVAVGSGAIVKTE